MGEDKRKRLEKEAQNRWTAVARRGKKEFKWNKYSRRCASIIAGRRAVRTATAPQIRLPMAQNSAAMVKSEPLVM